MYLYDVFKKAQSGSFYCKSEASSPRLEEKARCGALAVAAWVRQKAQDCRESHLSSNSPTYMLPNEWATLSQDLLRVILSQCTSIINEVLPDAYRLLYRTRWDAIGPLCDYMPKCLRKSSLSQSTLLVTDSSSRNLIPTQTLLPVLARREDGIMAVITDLATRTKRMRIGASSAVSSSVSLARGPFLSNTDQKNFSHFEADKIYSSLQNAEKVLRKREEKPTSNIHNTFYNDGNSLASAVYEANRSVWETAAATVNESRRTNGATNKRPRDDQEMAANSIGDEILERTNIANNSELRSKAALEAAASAEFERQLQALTTCEMPIP